MVISHIALHVAHLEKSTLFYKDIMGLKPIPEPFQIGMHSWFQVGPHCQLHLIAGARESVEKNMNNHLAFTTESIETFIKRLTEAHFDFCDAFGIKNKIHIRPDGIQQVFFQDPDGYWLEVNNDVKQ
jgi:lactoylglutathione lyase